MGDEPRPADRELELFADGDWQMAWGERAAVAGILAALRPRLAIELGTAEGGSLRTIAAYSKYVHSFDLVPAIQDPPANVTLHVGDSHALLPALLRRLEEERARVDFALVDGDHSAGGVRRDLTDLLASAAVARAVILVHDTANEAVRAGLGEIDWTAHPKVRYVDLAFVELLRPGGMIPDAWGGLGLVIVDEEGGLAGLRRGTPAVLRHLTRSEPLARRAAAPLRAAVRRARGAARERLRR